VTRKWKSREQIHVISHQGDTIKDDLLWREYELRANVKRFSRHSEDVHDAR
jgi:hypothetical protein